MRASGTCIKKIKLVTINFSLYESAFSIQAVVCRSGISPPKRRGYSVGQVIKNDICPVRAGQKGCQLRTHHTKSKGSGKWIYII